MSPHAMRGDKMLTRSDFLVIYRLGLHVCNEVHIGNLHVHLLTYICPIPVSTCHVTFTPAKVWHLSQVLRLI